jgi:hypothetical protein
MSNPIVQHKSATGLNPLSVTLNSPVTSGNLIIVGFMDSGEETSLPTSLISNSLLQLSWNLAIQQLHVEAGEPYNAAIFYTIVPGTKGVPLGSLTVTLTDVQFNLTNLHVYEVAGYNALDVTGVFTDLTNSPVTSGSVSTSAVSNFYDEFVFALFYGVGVGAGNYTWTGQSGNEGTETTQQANGFDTSFSEGFETTYRIKQTAKATVSTVLGNGPLIGLALIATFYNTSNASVPASPSLTAAPTLTPLFSDGFVRGNVSPLGAPWALDAENDGGLQIASDLCLAAVQTPSPLAAYTGVQLYNQVLPSDQFASATLGAALPSGRQITISVRVTDNGGAPTSWPGYSLAIIGGGVWILSGGLGGFAIGSGLTFNVGDVFTLAAVGTSIYFLQNGILIHAVTDVAVASGGAALGLSTFPSVNAAEISNFTAGSASVITEDLIYTNIDRLFPGLDSAVRHAVHAACNGWFITHRVSNYNSTSGWDGVSPPNIQNLVAYFQEEPPNNLVLAAQSD